MESENIKRFFIIWIWFAVWFPSQTAMGAMPLNEYITKGLEQNNEIQSLNSKLDALKAEIDYAGSLSDPRVGIGLLNLPSNSFRFDREPMTQKQIFVTQRLPWFGKLNLKSRRAALKVQRQALLIKGKKLELARKITTAYYELSYLNSALGTNAKLRELVGNALQVAHTRYATGRGLQQDIFQGQVEISKLEDEELTLKKKYRKGEDAINALLNQETFLAVTTMASPELPDLNQDKKSLTGSMMRNNPWLLLKSVDIEIVKRGLDLAWKDYWPDTDVRLAYGQRDENKAGDDLADFVSASVTMNIPLWHKKRQDRKVAAVRSEEEARRRSYRALMLSLPHRLDSILTDIEKAKAGYSLYQEQLIPQTMDWSSSALAAYEVGKVDFDTMIKARLRALRFQLQAKKYYFDVLKKQAELMEIIGGEPAVNKMRSKGDEL